MVRNEFTPAGPAFNLNGWEASYEHKATRWVGVALDVSRQQGFRSRAGFPVHERNSFVLLGPQFSPPVSRRVLPFAHVLFGMVVGTGFYVGSPANPGPYQRARQVVGTGSNSASPLSSGYFGWAAAIGGGVDFKIHGPLWIRVIQADYLPSRRLDDDHKMEARISTGITLRL